MAGMPENVRSMVLKMRNVRPGKRQNGEHMKNGRKIFWGVLFILGALALLVSQLGYLQGFGFWNILFTIGLIGAVVDGIFHKNYGLILFGLAFLVIVNDKLLGMESITPWPVLGAALLGTIGLSFMFPNHKWNKHIGGNWTRNEDRTTQGEMGEMIRYECSFGEAVKYIDSQELCNVDAECAFGSLSIYFNNAVLKNGLGMVNAECSFGNLVLYVPSDWKVELNVQTAFGAAEEKGRCNYNGSNILRVSGDVSFGALEIRYI